MWGDILSTVGDVQYLGDILSTNGVFSAVGVILSTVGDIQYREDIIMYMGDIMSTVGVFSIMEENLLFEYSVILHSTHDITHSTQIANNSGSEQPPWYS